MIRFVKIRLPVFLFLFLSAFCFAAWSASLATLVSVSWSKADSKTATLLIQGNAPLIYKDLTQTGTLHVVIELEGTARGSLPPFISSDISGIRQVFIPQVSSNTTQVIVTLNKTFPYTIKGISNGLAVVFNLAKPEEKGSPGKAATLPTPASSFQTHQGEETEVIPVHYADVSEIVGILTGQYVTPGSIFTPVTQPFPSLNTSVYSGGTPSPQPQSPLVPGGSEQAMGMRINDHIAVDKRINAIIVTGTPEYIAQVKDLISKVDVPVPMILLETRILEISETGSKDLGVDWAADPLFSLGFNESPGEGGAPGSQSAINNPYGTSPPVLLPKLGLNPFLRTPIQFAAALHALIQKGEAKELADPRILTLDGVNANIITGNQIPIRQTLSPGFGLPVTSQVQYINVGVDLQVLPHVNADGYITTNIYAQVSSVTGFQTSNVGGTTESDPIIASRSTQTMAMVKNGETIVIGGLLQTQDIKQTNMIPLLGQIPIIGELFRFSSTTHQKTNLVILITPRVIKP